MCKDVVIETELMLLWIENDSHEDVELQSSFDMPWMFLSRNIKMLKCPLNVT